MTTARALIAEDTTMGWLLLIFLGLVVALVMIEGKRQERIYGKSTGRPNLIGAGLLELQQQLQADRKVDTLQQQQKGEETAVAEQDESGEPPSP